MSRKKILLKAARTQKQKKEIERMTETEAADLLQNLIKEEKKK